MLEDLLYCAACPLWPAVEPVRTKIAAAMSVWRDNFMLLNVESKEEAHPAAGVPVED